MQARMLHTATLHSEEIDQTLSREFRLYGVRTVETESLRRQAVIDVFIIA